MPYIHLLLTNFFVQSHLVLGYNSIDYMVCEKNCFYCLKPHIKNKENWKLNITFLNFNIQR